MTFDACLFSCYSNSTCKYISFDRNLSRCYYQLPEPLRSTLCYKDMVCGAVKSIDLRIFKFYNNKKIIIGDARDLKIENLIENKRYTVKLSYETHFSKTGEIIDSYITSKFDSNSTTNESNLLKIFNFILHFLNSRDIIAST